VPISLSYTTPTRADPRPHAAVPAPVQVVRAGAAAGAAALRRAQGQARGDARVLLAGDPPTIQR
jgi:hypothetical protein